jgi:predicted 3-demethylubiquinone-9 3-methyltransferase (glyoxalase superfamily)
VASKVHRLTTCLWFNTQAEEAASFYTSVFSNSSILSVTRYGKERHEISGISEGTVMTVKFQLDGQEFMALNGGPQYHFTEAVSFVVNCDSQEEVDYYWEKLSAGGDEKAQVCGWLKDRFGVSWQVVPTELFALVSDPDPDKSGRATKAMLQMKKLDLAALRKAFEGE